MWQGWESVRKHKSKIKEKKTKINKWRNNDLWYDVGTWIMERVTALVRPSWPWVLLENVRQNKIGAPSGILLHTHISGTVICRTG